MLKLKSIPKLLTIISKIDLKPIINNLKQLDVFSLDQKEFTSEQMAVLAAEVLSELLPQLSKIESDIIPFICLYKEISVEQAEQLDVLEIIKEISADEGVVSFFKSALSRMAKQ